MHQIKNLLNKNWFACLVFFFLILVVFISTTKYNLVGSDDHALVVYEHDFNSKLSNIDQVFNEDIFRTPMNNGYYYRPILRLSFMLDAQISKENSYTTSHTTNMFLHFIAVIFFFFILVGVGINKKVSFFSSLLFSIHPIVSHSVAWIPGRNDTLLAIFVLATILFFIKHLENKKFIYFLGSVLALFASLLTKEVAVLLPAILISYYLLFVKNIQKQNLKELGFYVLGWGFVVSIWFIFRFIAIGGFIGSNNTEILGSMVGNLPSLIPAFGKFLLPLGLSVTPTIEDMSIYYGLIVIIFLMLSLVFNKQKNIKLLVFGVVWTMTFLLISLIKPRDINPDFMENRLYLPLMGFIIFCIGVFDGLLKRERLKKFLLFFVFFTLIIFSFITSYRNNYYYDRMSFWKNAVSTSPSHPGAHLNMGITYYSYGLFDKAKNELQHVSKNFPGTPFTSNYLGLIYMNEGKYDQAEESFITETRVLKYNPEPWINLGILSYKLGDLDKAKFYWEKALGADINNRGDFVEPIKYYYHTKNLDDFKGYVFAMKQEGLYIPEKVYNLISK